MLKYIDIFAFFHNRQVLGILKNVLLIKKYSVVIMAIILWYGSKVNSLFANVIHFLQKSNFW